MYIVKIAIKTTTTIEKYVSKNLIFMYGLKICCLWKKTVKPIHSVPCTSICNQNE